jgi:hypothetical protein
MAILKYTFLGDAQKSNISPDSPFSITTIWLEWANDLNGKFPLLFCFME